MLWEVSLFLCFSEVAGSGQENKALWWILKRSVVGFGEKVFWCGLLIFLSLNEPGSWALGVCTEKPGREEGRWRAPLCRILLCLGGETACAGALKESLEQSYFGIEFCTPLFLPLSPSPMSFTDTLSLSAPQSLSVCHRLMCEAACHVSQKVHTDPKGKKNTAGGVYFLYQQDE